MLNAVEKLYSILVRLGSLIINVFATLKCVGLQKNLCSLAVVSTLATPYTNTCKIPFYARWSPGPRSLAWVSSKSILTILAVHGISAIT